MSTNSWSQASCPAAGRHRESVCRCATLACSATQATRFAERLAVLAGIGERFDIADTIVVAARGLAERLLPEGERGLPLLLVAQGLRRGAAVPRAGSGI